MYLSKLWMAVAGLLAGLLLVACGQTTSVSADKPKPVVVEKIAGSEFNQLTLTDKAAERLAITTAPLTDKAAERLAITTAPVREAQIEGAPRKLIPYASVIYGLKGETWAYTSPKPLTFMRTLITIERIDGDTAVLVEGPPAGTAVVTVGVAELYGADTGIGK